MSQLSEHEQHQVDTASKRHAERLYQSEFFADKCASDFKAGITFALDHLFAGRMERLLQTFGDWLWRNYKQIDAQVWKERWSTSDTVYTLYQVIAKYLQHLETIKQKEDVRP